MYKCEYCGKELEHKIYDNSVTKIVCGDMECWSKYFWEDIIEKFEYHKKNDNGMVVINGSMYTIGKISQDEYYNSKYNGFGGSKFKIRMLDGGEVIETNNLWCNGSIPLEYRDRLKDTAKFINY